ncbi:MAG: hypothetical protein JEY99_18795 [Spirochaetales bacterium]|nr:hypothetical protein [Spirochaetales bacterium]
MNRRVLFMRFTMIILFLLIMPFLISGQEAADGAGDEDLPSLALLIQGPLFTEGIPFLAPNGLPSWSGRYLLGDEEIVVYFSWEQLIIPEDWETFNCSRENYPGIPFRAGQVYYITSPKGWAVFIYFAEAESDHCRFIDRFLNRLNYFLGISDTFSLPAVIEL